VKLPAQFFYARLLLAIVVGVFSAALTYFHLVKPLDRMVYDAFNEVSHMSVADDLVIVAIDENSLRELGRWPWPREKHVELLRRLSAAGVAAVAMDILFVENDSNYPEVDALLAEIIAELGVVVLPVFIVQDVRGGRLREVKPVEPIASAAAGLGHVHIEVDSDGVARSVFLKEGVGLPRWDHFTVAINRLLGQDQKELPGVLNPNSGLQADNSTIVRSHLNLIPFMGPAGTVDTISYVDVMKGRAAVDSLRGKIVLVGATAAGHVDNITTSLGQLSGVEVNANILQALRTEQLARPLSRDTLGVAISLFAAFSILLFTRMAPRQLLLAALASAILLPLLSFVLFHFWRLWISPAPIVLTLLVAYPLWNWLRLDAAVDFIGEHLQDLQNENHQLAPLYNWSDVERAAEFMVSLGHISRWEWDSGQVFDSDGHCDMAWKHERACSSKLFLYCGQIRRLLVFWSPGQEFVASSLRHIFPELDREGIQQGPGDDFVNLNLLALDNAYAQARRNRDLMQDTLEQLESAVILSELSGELVLINKQARLLLDLADDCNNLLVALGGLDLAEPQSIEDLVSQLIFRGLHFNHEGIAIASGREILCRGGTINLDRPMLLIVIMDVSDLKKSEKRRVEALNFLSHDLRAPLTSVLALLESAKAEKGAGYDGLLLDQIEEYIEKNLSYAENFIQLAKLEHDDTLRFDDCDASSLIDNAVAQLFHSAQKRGVELRILYCEEALWLRCNRSLLERALINLIDNALKHSREGGRITIELEADSQYAIFSVSDQGVGIAAGDMEQIFGCFAQGAGATAGVGLGLRFVSAVSRSHAGSVSVMNNLPNGARFVLSIPRESGELPD